MIIILKTSKAMKLLKNLWTEVWFKSDSNENAKKEKIIVTYF